MTSVRRFYTDAMSQYYFFNVYEDVLAPSGFHYGRAQRTHKLAMHGRSCEKNVLGVEVRLVTGLDYVIIGLFSDAELRKWKPPKL